MLILLVVVVVAAAATYVLTRPPSSPVEPPNIPTSPEVPVEPTLPPEGSIEAGPLEPIEVIEDETETETETETTSEDEETIETETEETEQPDMNSTAANDGMTDGINEAYFAKKEYKASGNETADNSPYRYEFRNTQNFSSKTRATVAGEILTIIKDELAARKEFAKVDTIEAALTEPSYAGSNSAGAGNGGTVEFEIYKMTPEYVKTDNAPLESDLYVFAKTTNLDEKEITITIQEKEELLVGANAPLPVLERDDAAEEVQNSEDLEEITELKGTIDEGFIAIPIRLRPKADEDLQEWKEKLDGKQSDTYSYEVANSFSVEGDAEAIASSIERKSNEALAPDFIVKKENITELLTEGASFETGHTFNLPKYSTEKVWGKLWLKASAQGEEELYEEEFLNEINNDSDTAENEESDETETTAQKENYFVIGGICVCEARVRAYMRMLRVGEGTVGERGYVTLFGGVDFTAPPYNRDMSDHPRIQRPFGATTSSAAGAYQVMGYTWDDANMITRRTQYGIENFEQLSQDRFCIVLFKHKRAGMLELIIAGNIREATAEYGSREWASLPMNENEGRYGQPNKTMTEALALYETFLQEELAGDSDLYLPDGFLSEFGYSCCNDSSDGWHHPLDTMELRGWYNSGFYPGSSDHGDAPIRFSNHHDGLDLYAPIGTTVYACVDGEIYEDYISGTYGNTLGIKGTYNGSTYYFFYAHLSERDVAKGDTVKAGDIIGKTGKSGNASGQAAKMNHLHFEVRNTSSRTGGRLDPLTTIAELGADVNTSPDEASQTGN
ncbi:peptidoglycan DD-metalloendopeptidase family protein [Cochleicola gelatinilyticus]|uniref:M23ase beta-sheet core domain-containing protein n=1 Tax=Cochleicola gelatinilyticus TaxID=1763537 RepID=A0A167H571_9FLAO|nr:peptidoglycan DD-metalloendopeptidase family protein [Cochleicola gelatinilyticus]OAB78229.1 hypothetical protein ULVI_12185 [Cochleicola gelatinilyticus]